MKPILSLLVAAALLAGCAPLAQRTRPAPVPAQVAPVEPVDPEKAEAAEEERAIARLPTVDLTPQLLYGFLLAEIAGRRGQLADAAALYLELARETRDPRIARRAAEIALHSRYLETALQATRIWLEADPASAQARQAYIGLLATLGRHDELQSEVTTLLAAEPQQLRQNLLHLNRLFSRSGDRQAVHVLVENLTAPYLHLAEAHFARAQVAFEARDLPAAREAIRRALELRPDWELAALFRIQLIENRAEAMTTLAAFIAAHPQAREARLAYARALATDKRYPEARREFGVLLEQGAVDPAKNGDVVFALAVLSLQLNDTQEAEKHLRQLVQIGHAESDKARYYLGQIAEDGKRWDEALQWFGTVERGEHYLSARLHAASVMAKQGRIEEARRHLAGSDAGNPRERAQLLIGEAQLLREAGRNADAHAALTAALVRQPDQPDLLYEIALLAEKLGRVDELESRLRRLIEIKPDHAHALNALGYSLAERNIRLAEARTLIERALELAPNDPFILDSKGWVLFRQGEVQAALDVLNQAFGIRPDPEIAAHLGEVLWALGRRDEARQTWEKARSAHPANEALAETVKRLQP